ncbi:MAG TPA: DUF2516 family protein [Streptosporangiaceae bacterium]
MIVIPTDPLSLLFWILQVAAFAVEIWAFVDALRHSDGAYRAAGKQSKTIWLLILGVAMVIGLGSAANRLSLFSILPIAAFIGAAIYLVDVRPKVREFRGSSGGSSSSGPYGPW